MPFFFDIYFIYTVGSRYSMDMEVDKEQIYNTYMGFACGFVGWMWACSLDKLELY